MIIEKKVEYGTKYQWKLYQILKSTLIVTVNWGQLRVN
jgi:hypothetical protein